ncbi:MAG: DUF2461 domain-containing protein [Bacteroidales bacterium]|nr:DUF2461 domain-containing protein [Bacteroidales bacterium]
MKKNKKNFTNNKIANMKLENALIFLDSLQNNNNRNWFNENKEKYNSAKSEFETFVSEVIINLRAIDSSVGDMAAKDCMFRINRDVRFSNNKEPYKNNFGAFMAKEGRKSIYAGYYIHLEPHNSFIGGGIYMPEAKNLNAIRQHIYDNYIEFKKILENKTFKSYFPEIYGEKLKTAPKGFPKDFEGIDLLKHKHYAVTFPVDNKFWSKPDLVKNVMKVFEQLSVYNKFINLAFES